MTHAGAAGGTVGTVGAGVNISSTPAYDIPEPDWLLSPSTSAGSCGGSVMCVNDDGQIINLPQDPEEAGYEWIGSGEKGVERGNWVNHETGERINPDRKHEPPIGPHDDYTDPNGNKWRVDPEGNATPK